MSVCSAVDFRIGDEVVYTYNGGNSRLKYGDVGTVIDVRSNDSHPITVRFPDYEGRFYNVDGKDPTCSSIRCSAENVAVVDRAGSAMLLDELEGFLV